MSFGWIADHWRWDEHTAQTVASSFHNEGVGALLISGLVLVEAPELPGVETETGDVAWGGANQWSNRKWGHGHWQGLLLSYTS